ncbi:hypothetical protein EYV94_04550 [Puteibacter caeruleilacunae]|nr:hypothetical protein EYV94_04550 [Puteibacter caeruleilacunae]
MKTTLTALICVAWSCVMGQEPIKTFWSSGVVFDHDSIPVADAYVINYRNLNHYVTDSLGRFRMYVQGGDSLMISHITYKRMVIQAKKGEDFIYIIDIAPFEIDPVIIQQFDRNEENFKKNMATIRKTIKFMPKPVKINRGVDGNPYDPTRSSLRAGSRGYMSK